MSTKLRSFGDYLGNRLLSVALLLCGLEIAVMLLAILMDLVLEHPPHVIVRANAISWLACGVASIVLGITALFQGPKRGAAIGVIFVSLAVFALCAARFAIV